MIRLLLVIIQCVISSVECLATQEFDKSEKDADGIPLSSDYEHCRFVLEELKTIKCNLTSYLPEHEQEK